MREAIQIIQMLALATPPSLPATSPRQWRAFSVPWEWCQRGPLKTAAVRSEMNALAEHNGPDLNTTRIDARSEPQQKKEGYSAPIQPCCYFISRKFASTIYTFCRFQVLWSRKHVDELPGGELPRFQTGFHVLVLGFFCCWLKRRRLCFCLTADLHRLGQPLPRQVGTQAPDQGPADRRHRWSAAGRDHPGCR